MFLIIQSAEYEASWLSLLKEALLNIFLSFQRKVHKSISDLYNFETLFISLSISSSFLSLSLSLFLYSRW